MYQNLWNADKSSVEKFTALNAYIKNKQVSIINSHLKNLGKKSKINSKQAEGRK